MGETIPAFPFSTFPSLSLNQVHLTYGSLPLPFPPIQDLSAEDPALERKDILISIPQKIRAKSIYEIQRLTSLL